MVYDLAIIGGGPAGVAAGVYASRKALKTVFITKEWGGQSVVSADIQNWIGTISVSGEEFAKMLREHLEAYAGDTVDIVAGECVTNVTKTDLSAPAGAQSPAARTAGGGRRAGTRSPRLARDVDRPRLGALTAP